MVRTKNQMVPKDDFSFVLYVEEKELTSNKKYPDDSITFTDRKTFNRQFIAAIRPHRCLYDAQCKGQDKKDTIWKQLSIQFKVPVLALRTRYNSLRIGMFDYLRAKLRFKRAMRAGKNPRPSKPFYLYSEMQFLVPYSPAMSKLMDMTSDFTDSDDEGPSLDDSDPTQSQQDYDVPPIESVFVKEEDAIEEDANEDVEDPNLNIMNAFEMESDPAESTDKPEVSLAKTEPVESPEPEASLTLITPLIEPAESPSGPMSSQHPTHDYEGTSEWDFFQGIMPAIMNMTEAQKGQMRMRIIGVIDDILEKEEE